MAASKPREALEFPDSDRAFLEPHLPPPKNTDNSSSSSAPELDTPFVTLTFATSLDSSLALTPGRQTALSGPRSKAMTHYLRSRHDAILIGAGTAVADDPSLNCRLAGVGGYGGGPGLAGQPRPVVVDPHGRWRFTAAAKLFRLCREGRGRPPWIVTAVGAATPPAEQRELLEAYGGRYVHVELVSDGEGGKQRLDWYALFRTLKKEGGLDSVMVEGGGQVINSLLEPRYLSAISMVIVTIAPTWLGQGGVVVSPARRLDEDGNAIPAVRLTNAKWYPFGEDVVLCGSVRT